MIKEVLKSGFTLTIYSLNSFFEKERINFRVLYEKYSYINHSSYKIHSQWKFADERSIKKFLSENYSYFSNYAINNYYGKRNIKYHKSMSFYGSLNYAIENKTNAFDNYILVVSNYENNDVVNFFWYSKRKKHNNRKRRVKSFYKSSWAWEGQEKVKKSYLNFLNTCN